MDKLEQLKNKIRQFVDDRDWNQFHSPENLAKSVAIEAAELLECFQWDNEYDLEAVCDEIADVYVYLLDLSEVLGVDLIDITNKKMDKNTLKYPVDKARGNNTKYNKL